MIAGVLVSVPATADGPPRSGPPGPWSAPAALSACAAAGGARVLFPSESPTDRTGPGAIVWSAAPRCPGGAGARVSVLGRGEMPGRSTLPRSTAGAVIAPYGALEASAAPRGQIVIAGSRPANPSELLLIQGAAGGPFSVLPEVASASSPASITRAYLGDVALESTPTSGSGGLRVQRERFFAQNFAAPVTASPGGTPSDPTVALDFRTDTLATWIQGSSLYARYLPTKGYPRAIQRLATVAPGTQVSSLLSDDGHGIVAWTETRGPRVSVHLDISGAGVGFGAQKVLESFDAPDARRPPTAPLLLRLRSEAVMIAWTGASAGHWVLRSAPVELGGLGTVDTYAPGGQDAMLQALAAGPDGEALMLWDQSQGPAAASAIYAARGFQALHRRVVFETPELIQGPATNSLATVAIDPSGDDAVAAWRGAHGAIEYSIRAAAAAPPAALPSGRSARQGADREG